MKNSLTAEHEVQKHTRKMKKNYLFVQQETAREEASSYS